MTKEFIEREVAIKAFNNFDAGRADSPPLTLLTPEEFAEYLYELPAADVVEVVRCKDCKYYAALMADMVIGDMEEATWGICLQPWFNSDEYDVDENGFCSYGERKENE